MTAFASVTVDVGGDLSFTIDGNAKITCDRGTFEEPQPNALSLPNIAACPGSTPACRATCYVHGLNAAVPALASAYAANLGALLALLASPSGVRNQAARNLATWIDGTLGAGAHFRWHVSGDVVSTDHARWIRRVCTLSPTVHFWIYTHSLFAVPLLAGTPNLTLYVSADGDNCAAAFGTAERFDTRVAWLARPNEAIPMLRERDVIFPDYPLRGRRLARPADAVWWRALSQAQRRLVCPTDFFGQSPQHRCGPCRHCIE